MSLPHPVVAERTRLRRRNTGVAMGFAVLLCLVGVVWATNTLGQVGDRAAVDLVPETAQPSIPEPGATPVESESSAPPAETTTAPPPPPVTRFVSPSGNISCAISEAGARCDIADKTWDAGPAPEDCTATWGQGVTVTAAAGPVVVCAKESLVGAGGETLEYGRDVSVGDFTCASSEAGMRCAQVSTGAGFAISRRAHTFF